MQGKLKREGIMTISCHTIEWAVTETGMTVSGSTEMIGVVNLDVSTLTQILNYKISA